MEKAKLDLRFSNKDLAAAQDMMVSPAVKYALTHIDQTIKAMDENRLAFMRGFAEGVLNARPGTGSIGRVVSGIIYGIRSARRGYLYSVYTYPLLSLLLDDLDERTSQAE